MTNAPRENRLARGVLRVGRKNHHHGWANGGSFHTIRSVASDKEAGYT